MKVKFCGLKTQQDILMAHQLQVDAIGLVFVENSPRHVTINQAIKLARVNQHQSELVALFVDPSVDTVRLVIEKVKPDVLQFHGSENADFCCQFGLPYWKAIAMLDDQWNRQIDEHPQANRYVLDAFGAGQSGGSGVGFHWFHFSDQLKSRAILAGGLRPDNVRSAITQTGAQYLDVSSGIESKRGVKSSTLMQQFITEVRLTE